MLLTVHPDIGLMVVENVAKIVYGCLLASA